MLGRLKFLRWWIEQKNNQIGSESKSQMHASESFKVSYNSLNNRINPNTKNNSNNGNSETAKPSLVFRMIESHRTQHYLH
jgi:hypothetical protein